MNITFLYPESAISPHIVHKTWAKSIGSHFVQTPKAFGKFNLDQIPPSDALLLESLYCLPFAKRYHDKNPECKIICIIADTSFWKEKLNILRKVYYWKYLRYVDAFITVSERIKRDILDTTHKKVEVVRPFPINTYNKKVYNFNKNILFIGNDAREKGYGKLVAAMKYLKDYELYLVGSCSYKVKSNIKNIHKEGRVESIKKYLELCSLYAHPADFDPCPVSVFEAMFSGIIPIITRGVGQSELIPKNREYLILEDNSPEKIAESIIFVNGLSKKTKLSIAKEMKKISSMYTEKKSTGEFKIKFNQLL